MFRKSLRCLNNFNKIYVRYLNLELNQIKSKQTELTTTALNEDSHVEKPTNTESVLEPCQEDISHVAPYLKPTFNFAAYVNKSETLQQLVKLGVDLYKLERIRDVPPFLLKLKFENDIKPYILFLNDVKINDIGHFITKNPFIFKQDIDNLYVRLNYLKLKKFNDEMLTRMFEKNPVLLNLSTREIDERLGLFQHMFSLSGNEVRQLAVKSPKLITYPEKKIKINVFSLKEEMGFSKDELKNMILDCPSLLIKEKHFMLDTFEYLHNVMKIPLEQIAQTPQILTFRKHRLQQRHEFLASLGKVQYDPKKPKYISVLTLVSGTDSEFCSEVAETSIQIYNTYLKTL